MTTQKLSQEKKDNIEATAWLWINFRGMVYAVDKAERILNGEKLKLPENAHLKPECQYLFEYLVSCEEHASR